MGVEITEIPTSEPAFELGRHLRRDEKEEKEGGREGEKEEEGEEGGREGEKEEEEEGGREGEKEEEEEKREREKEKRKRWMRRRRREGGRESKANRRKRRAERALTDFAANIVVQNGDQQNVDHDKSLREERRSHAGLDHNLSQTRVHVCSEREREGGNGYSYCSTLL